MKTCLLSFLTLFICNITVCQISDFSINLEENFCDEPDVLSLQFEPISLVGTYNYLTTDLNCVTGEVMGTIEITQDPYDETLFFVDDFSFGLFEACFSIDPPTGNLNWKYENFLISWNGSDNYGEQYMFNSFASNGKDWTFTYSDTYGDMATVQLTREDGKDIPYATTDATQATNPDLSILWSTGETTPSIEITANGTYSVTVSDANQEETASIQILDWNESHPDLPALKDIYTKSAGSNWTENEGWRQAFDEDNGCNPCNGNWFGIECDNNRVINLSLPNNNLDGQISIALGFLDRIKVIDLSDNNLSGFIPSQITAGLPLEELTLRNNALSGPFPLELTSIASLEILDLSGNELNETIPVEIGEMNLQILSLSRNQFEGEIPSQIGQIQQLGSFLAFSNQLTGEIPIELFAIPSISTIIISNNFLTGTLPENIISSSLGTINLANNNLTGTIPESYLTLPLFRLNLSFNNFEGEVPEFTNLGPFLIDFNLAGNKFEGDLPVIPQDIAIINFLLNDNNFSGTIPESYKSLTSNRSFNLSNNNLTGTLFDDYISKMEVRVFDVSHNNLSGDIPSFIGEVENPFRVDLSHNDFGGCYPMMDSLCLLGYSEIDTLALSNNGVMYTLDNEPGYDFTNNPKLPWLGFADNFCGGDNQIGAPCDDGNSATTNEAIANNCICSMIASTHEINGQILTVYPNPSNHFLNIEIPESNNLKAQLYNSTGQLIRQMNFNTSNNISDLNSGIYVLEIVDKVKNISVIERIVVE